MGPAVNVLENRPLQYRLCTRECRLSMRLHMVYGENYVCEV